MKKLIFLLLFPFMLQAQTPEQSESEQAQNPAQQLIESYRQKVVSGENTMSELARRYSEDPGSAKNGGLILNVTRGMMVPEFEAVAFSLKTGEVSKVFETQYGYHFIQLLEHNGESVNLRHILVMLK